MNTSPHNPDREIRFIFSSQRANWEPSKHLARIKYIEMMTGGHMQHSQGIFGDLIFIEIQVPEPWLLTPQRRIQDFCKMKMEHYSG